GAVLDVGNARAAVAIEAAVKLARAVAGGDFSLVAADDRRVTARGREEARNRHAAGAVDLKRITGDVRWAEGDRQDRREQRGTADRLGPVLRTVERVLLEVGKQEEGPAPAGADVVARRQGGDETGRETAEGGLVIVHRQAHLLQIVLALGSRRRLAHLL